MESIYKEISFELSLAGNIVPEIGIDSRGTMKKHNFTEMSTVFGFRHKRYELGNMFGVGIDCSRLRGRLWGVQDIKCGL